MQITHVIRGDDHVNNTPRQINIFNALGAKPPVYAHLPTVLNEAGEKMSKRNGAKAVTKYRDEGFLPDAMVNYLARLGWSHGDDEIFSRSQFLTWFNLDHLGRSAAQFDEAKLKWVNAQHIKALSDEELAKHVSVFLEKENVTADERIPLMCGLFKDRCDTLVSLAKWVKCFYAPVHIPKEERDKHLGPQMNAALELMRDKLAKINKEEWNKESISLALKQVLSETGLKMPQLAMPVRVLLMGTAQTPSLDAVIAIFDQKTVIERLNSNSS